MLRTYQETNIFYRYFDRKSEVVNVFLHGWGSDHKSLMFCHKFLGASSLFVDFPPFGQSGSNIKHWTIFTYANMVISLCQHLNIKKFNLIGHSFGGRVAIIIAVLCKDMTNKVVLIDSAGLKPHRKPSYYFKVWAFKLKRKLGLDTSKYGSCDYLALSADLRRVFNNVVNTHLDDFLPLIKCPCLIVFGQNDTTTPLYMARRFKRKIKNSKLVILEGAGHFCFVDRRLEFLSALKDFLQPEKEE